MSDVLLVFPSFTANRKTPTITGIPGISNAVLPLPLISLGTYLKQNGIAVECLDTRLYSSKEALRKVEAALKNGVYLVGVSVKTATIPDALQISEFVKMHDPEIKVVCGGIHPTLFPEQTVKDKAVDFVVVGEGEVSLYNLAFRLKRGDAEVASVPNLVWKQGQSVIANQRAPFLNLDTLPIPDYSLLETDRYIRRRDYRGKEVRALDVQFSRGCPHRCSFCVNTIVSRSIYRKPDATRVIEQVKRLVADYKLNHINFLDENFFVDARWTETIMRALVDIGVSWVADCRADYFRRFNGDYLEFMRRSGCKGLFIGVESGSERILSLLKKDISIDDSLRAVTACAKYGIETYVSIMMGLPSETKSDLLCTLRLMKALRKAHPGLLWSGPQLFRPYPGGELYEMCKQSGFVEPTTLREWGQARITGYSDAFPWIKDTKLLNLFKTVDIYMSILNLSDYWRPQKGVRLLARLLAPVARFRWYHEFWSFPLLAWVIRFGKVRNAVIWWLALRSGAKSRSLGPG